MSKNAMTDFIAALRSERAQLQATIADFDRQLGPAQAALDKAREHLDAHRQLRRLTDRDGRGHVLTQAVSDANNAVCSLETKRGRAVQRVADIDRLLSAEADERQARSALRAIDSKMAEPQGALDRLNAAVAEINSEIATLEVQRQQIISAHGKTALQARLEGKAASTPTNLREIDADIESRASALAATTEAQQELESKLADLRAEHHEAVLLLRGAMMRTAELRYYALLPQIKAVVAPLIAQSFIGANVSLSTFTVQLSAADIAAAEREFEDAIN